MKKTVVLVILDGWGMGTPGYSNPVYAAEPATLNYIRRNFPAGTLQSSGIAVGLPWGEEGNSEAGHLTLGAGKIIYQHYPKITLAIQNGSFFENPALKSAFRHARENNSSVHLAGILTSGNIHASFTHLIALLEMAKKENCDKIYLHLFSDGRDSSPNSAALLIEKINSEIKRLGVGIVASLSGRHYAMNRDGDWSKTEIVYKTITGQSQKGDILKAAASVKEKGLTDEYVAPTASFNGEPIKDGDALILFNFREDSMRQISEPFLDEKFVKFPTLKFKNLRVATMTRYHEWQNETVVAFQSEGVKTPLGKVLADRGLFQLRVAETQKHAHVTYFFNGFRREPFLNEYRVLLPTKNLTHPEENPEMMAPEITDRVVSALNEGSFDFILVNYANLDVIAHTGNFDATVKAVKVVDRELKRFVEAVTSGGHIAIITSDHGNAESVMDYRTGEIQTKHDPNPVPIYLVAEKLEKKNRKGQDERIESVGFLSDVAPTVLHIMNIPKPPEMTGESLLNQLK